MNFTAFRPAFGLALLAPGLALAQGGQYTLNGQLGPKAGYTHAYLSHGEGAAHRIDSTEVTQGRFSFKGAATTPELATLMLTKQTLRIPIMMPSKVRIAETKLYLEPGTVRVFSRDSLPNATLAGTPLNVDQTVLLALTRVSTAQMDAVMSEWRKAPTEKKQDKAYEADVDKRYDAAEATKKAVLKQFIQSHPGSLVSLDAVKDFGGYALDPTTVGPLFDGLAPAVRQTAAGQEYAAKIDKARKVAVGAMAPEFTQGDVNGKPVKLSDYRGKYVLVDFWASWCGPCRRENPNVVTNYDKFKSRNFTVLGVSLDQPTGRDKWLKAIADDNLAWTQVSDLKFWKNEVAQLYGINSIPQNFLIGPDGRIVAKNLRGDELSQKLAALLPAGAQ